MANMNPPILMEAASDRKASQYSKEELDTLRQQIKEKKVRFIFVVYSDFHAMERGKALPVERFLSRLEEGILMAGMQLLRLPKMDIPAMPELPLSIEFNDLRLFPDLKTFKVIPWRKDVATVIADPYDVMGQGAIGFSPRNVARKQVMRLNECGYEILSALEYEFSALDAKTMAPIHTDKTGHWVKSFFQDWELLTEIYDNLIDIDLKVEQIDSEGENGVYEYPIKPSMGLQSADDGFWVKKTVREISQRNGYLASFSSKPFVQSSGVSGHFNHSLLDLKTRKPLFFDGQDSDNMSKIMKHWLAGLLRHAPAMVIFGCPTASCQRRFVHFDRATPRNPSWGVDNRTCSFRVKSYGPNQTYIENRIFAAACNPYLTLAVNIAAGLDGVLNELPLPPMVNWSAHHLHKDDGGLQMFSGKLSDAIKALEEDDVICEALGEEFIKTYLNNKKHECQLEAKAQQMGDKSFYDREYLPFL
ncbi:lengsin-like [Apostichopus japonicus]|uniref:lengsin-like n=1 Tax=Stichopus japonicus TaxID=307972 RepID=UPI003AB7561A